MQRKYMIGNVRPTTRFEDGEKLDFKVPKKRLKKSSRKKLNEAIATVKGFGCLRPNQVSKVEYQSVVIDSAKLEHFVMQNHCELLRNFGCKDTVILMGNEEFYSIANQRVNIPLSFPLADFQTEHLQHHMAGMFIVVLPWMSGTVLVPKEFMPIDKKLIPSGIMVTAETQRKIQEEREGRIAAELWRREMSQYEDLSDE